MTSFHTVPSTLSITLTLILTQVLTLILVLTVSDFRSNSDQAYLNSVSRTVKLWFCTNASCSASKIQISVSSSPVPEDHLMCEFLLAIFLFFRYAELLRVLRMTSLPMLLFVFGTIWCCPIRLLPPRPPSPGGQDPTPTCAEVTIVRRRSEPWNILDHSDEQWFYIYYIGGRET